MTIRGLFLIFFTKSVVQNLSCNGNSFALIVVGASVLTSKVSSLIYIIVVFCDGEISSNLSPLHEVLFCLVFYVQYLKTEIEACINGEPPSG